MAQDLWGSGSGVEVTYLIAWLRLEDPFSWWLINMSLPRILCSLSVFMIGQLTYLREWSKREKARRKLQSLLRPISRTVKALFAGYQSVWHCHLDPSVRHKILALETEDVITYGTASNMIICIFLSPVFLPESHRWAQLDTCTCTGFCYRRVILNFKGPVIMNDKHACPVALQRNIISILWGYKQTYPLL